jgi:hypothetical protein
MTEPSSSLVTFSLVVTALLFQAAVASHLRTSDSLSGRQAVSLENRYDITNDELSANVGRQRLFARYDSLLGRRMVQSCASVIIQDDDDTDFTIFEGNSHCIEKLKTSRDVQLVDEDHPYQALPVFSSVSSSADFERTRRFLDEGNEIKEILPWGIEAIQADKLPQGEHDVTICVVDSGIAANHPDLDYNRISGVDRNDWPYNWPWREDPAGHGKSADTRKEIETLEPEIFASLTILDPHRLPFIAKELMYPELLLLREMDLV